MTEYSYLSVISLNHVHNSGIFLLCFLLHCAQLLKHPWHILSFIRDAQVNMQCIFQP